MVAFLTATAVAAGKDHTCALLADGAVQCWGGNGEGELGGGTTKPSPIPVVVTGIKTATAIATGGDHTCAVLSDGTVKCWGDNGHGQLGTTITRESHVPVAVAGF